MKLLISSLFLLLATGQVKATSIRAQDTDPVNTSIDGSTMTLHGQDPNGYSLDISSGARVKCITFKGDGSTMCSAPGQGSPVQHQSTHNTNYVSGLAGIDFADTIPTISSGTQVLSLTFTPHFASSRVRIHVVAFISAYQSAAIDALFINGTNQAAASGIWYPPSVGTAFASPWSVGPAIINYEYFPGNTNPITFTVRAGGSGNNNLNGTLGTRQLGGSLNTFMEVDEFTP